MDVQHVSGAQGGQKKSSQTPLELELRMVINHNVGAGNWTTFFPALTPLISNNSTLRNEGGNGS